MFGFSLFTLHFSGKDPYPFVNDTDIFEEPRPIVP